MFDFPPYDLMPAQIILSITGALLAMMVMQLAAHDRIEPGERQCLRWLRRTSVALVAGGLLWAATYGLYREWQPWPPFIVVCIGIDLALLASVITGYLRTRA